MSAAFGFAADPRALDDLRQAPAHIRDLALLGLQDLVHGEQRGARLGERAGVDLTGYRRLYVDPAAQWRLVYAERPAPAGGRHPYEIFLLALGERDQHAVYNAAAADSDASQAPPPPNDQAPHTTSASSCPRRLRRPCRPAFCPRRHQRADGQRPPTPHREAGDRQPPTTQAAPDHPLRRPPNRYAAGPARPATSALSAADTTGPAALPSLALSLEARHRVRRRLVSARR